MTGALPIMPKVLELDAEAWALRITARWRASVEAIMEVGQLLIDAKGRLAHGEFGLMLETKLPFKARQAQMLMAIASDARLSNPQYIALLPASWGTLYDLTRLSDDELETAIKKQIIRPDMERKEIELIRPAPQKPRGIESSDGGVESGHAPEGSATVAASGLRERRPRDMEAAGSQREAEAGLPSEMTRAMEQASSRVSQDSDRIAGPAAARGRAGVAPGPSETTPLPNGARAIMGSRQEPSDSLDFFPTPPWATRALIERVFQHLGGGWNFRAQTAWEPACGEGHIAEVLREYCCMVGATDIFDYGYGDKTFDFLSDIEIGDEVADFIITNPPFGDKSEAFVLKALKHAREGVAMFVRMQWLETVGRYERIFRDHPPTLIAFFAERVPLCKGRWDPEGDTATAYVWLVWLKGEAPRAPFWIPPGCREALTRPDDVERFTQRPVAKRQSVENAEAAE